MKKTEQALREALKPFADAYRPELHTSTDDRKLQEFLDRNEITPRMTIGDFRRAHETLVALSQSEAPAEQPEDALVEISYWERRGAKSAAQESQLAELRQPTAQQVEDARDANLREAVIDAAYDWSQYVEVDTAPRTCSEHIALAFDAVLQAGKEKE